MPIQSHKLTQIDLKWFVEVAAVNMLVDELSRPELVNMNQLYFLAEKGMEEGTAFIAKDGALNVGALGSILIPSIFNPNIKTLSEIFWYVLPTYRKTRAGLVLLRDFEDTANHIANDATLSLLPYSLVNNESLEKRGFIMEEIGFRKQIRNI